MSILDLTERDICLQVEVEVSKYTSQKSFDAGTPVCHVSCIAGESQKHVTQTSTSISKEKFRVGGAFESVLHRYGSTRGV